MHRIGGIALLLCALACSTSSGDSDASVAGGSGVSGAGASGAAASGVTFVPGTPVTEANFSQALAEALCAPLEPCCRAAGLEYDGASCRTLAATVSRISRADREARGEVFNLAGAMRCVDQTVEAASACRERDEACDLYIDDTCPNGVCPAPEPLEAGPLELSTLAAVCAPAAPGSAPEAQFLADLSAELCTQARGCCEASNIAFDASVCSITASQALAMRWLGPRIGGLRAAFDAAGAAQCLAGLRAVQSCEWHHALIDCQVAYRGTLPEGSTECVSNLECIRPAAPGSRAFCAVESDESRRCVARAPVAEGQACSLTCGPNNLDSAECATFIGREGESFHGVCLVERGLACDPTLSVCAPRLPLGGTCLQSSQCESDFCSGGVCTAPLALGAACGGDLDICMTGLYCADVGACAPQLAEGETCERSQDCANGATCSNDACNSGPDRLELIGLCGGT